MQKLSLTSLVVLLCSGVLPFSLHARKLRVHGKKAQTEKLAMLDLRPPLRMSKNLSPADNSAHPVFAKVIPVAIEGLNAKKLQSLLAKHGLVLTERSTKEHAVELTLESKSSDSKLSQIAYMTLQRHATGQIMCKIKNKKKELIQSDILENFWNNLISVSASQAH